MLVPVTLKIPANTDKEIKLASVKLRGEILKNIFISAYNWKLRAGVRFVIDATHQTALTIPSKTNYEEYITGHEFDREIGVGKKMEHGNTDIYGLNYDSKTNYVAIQFQLIDKKEIDDAQKIENDYNISLLRFG